MFAEEAAQEHITLTHNVGQLDYPQAAFNIKQKRPNTVDEAIAAMLEMESYQLPRMGQVRHVGLTEPKVATTSLVALVQSKQDGLMDMVQVVMERLDKLETTPLRNLCHPRMKPTSEPHNKPWVKLVQKRQTQEQGSHHNHLFTSNVGRRAM